LHQTKLADPEKSFDAFARAFKTDPAVDSAKVQLEMIAALLDDGWPRMVGLYEEALEGKDLDPSLGHDLAIKVARTYEERLGKTYKAVEFFKQALAIEPDDPVALSSLELIFSRDEKFPDL